MPLIGNTCARRVGAILVGVAATVAAQTASAAPAVSLELNRFEPQDNACRLSLVIGNPGDKAYDSLKLDMVFFNKEGVISRRMAVEAGPVRASKTTIKVFDAAGSKCDEISRVLLNDVTACGGEADCLALVGTSSKVKDVEFTK